jgi:diaminopimelate decarboxylase
MENLLDQPSKARTWLDMHGSPLHVLVASEFTRNVNDLLLPLRQRGISGTLFFARKANKLPWFVGLCKETGIGVDTASLRELQETLLLGVSPDQIVVTAISKGHELISLAISKGCLLIIDNSDELEMVRSVARSLGTSARIGLRFSGFIANGRKIFSRFGFPIADWPQLNAELIADPSLQIELFHAHLDRYDVNERALAARQLIDCADSAAATGRSISSIDLGGGILMRYLKEASQWRHFLDDLLSSIAGNRPLFTYQGDGLGYYKAGREVHGSPDLYPAWNDISKERFIAAILDHTKNGVPLHRELSARKIKLFFEPGRSLLDNVGITLAKVCFRKRDTSGNLLIGLEMNRTNLRPFRAEFCSDPILLSEESHEMRKKSTEGAFLVGNLCTESDLLFKRKLQLSYLPQPGDIFCFANTAGYLAHHAETGTHGGPLPTNLLVDEVRWEVLDQLETIKMLRHKP